LQQIEEDTNNSKLQQVKRNSTTKLPKLPITSPNINSNNSNSNINNTTSPSLQSNVSTSPKFSDHVKTFPKESSAHNINTNNNKDDIKQQDNNNENDNNNDAKSKEVPIVGHYPSEEIGCLANFFFI